MKEKWKLDLIFSSIINCVPTHTFHSPPNSLTHTHTHTHTKRTLVTEKGMLFKFHRFFRMQTLDSQSCGDWLVITTELFFSWYMELPSYHLLPTTICASGKESASQCRSHLRGGCSVPESGRSPGGGHSNPLQYCCLENPMKREAWWATVHGVTKSQTQLSVWTLKLGVV